MPLELCCRISFRPPFDNVCGNGPSGPPKLSAQLELFLSRQELCYFRDFQRQSVCLLVYQKVCVFANGGAASGPLLYLLNFLYVLSLSAAGHHALANLTSFSAPFFMHSAMTKF